MLPRGVLTCQTVAFADVRCDRASGRKPVMRRSMGIGIVLTAFCLALGVPSSRAQTPAEFAQTAAFAAAHQNKDGGFTTKVGGPSSLGATNSGLRTLRHVGGSVPDVLACVKYVKSCVTPEGGFAATPGGKPEIVATAIGLMAATELKISDPKMIRGAVAYLGKHARSFEEVRMAIAGLEAIGVSSPDIPQVERADPGHAEPGRHLRGRAEPGVRHRRGRRRDPPHGLEARPARRRRRGDQGRPASRGRLVQGRRTSRPGEHLPRHEMSLHAPREARRRSPHGVRQPVPEARRQLFQRPGRRRATSAAPTWAPSSPTGPASSSGCPRSSRRPDLPRWSTGTTWPDGKGIPSSGRPGMACSSATLPASITTSSWPRPAPTATSCFRSTSGCRTARVTAASSSVASASRGTRCPATRPTSARATGVHSTTSRGGIWSWSIPRSDATRTLNRSDWNRYVIRAMGDRINLSLNGQDSVREYREPDAGIARSGLVAVQIHAGGPMEIQFRDLMIQPLPTPYGREPDPAGLPPANGQDRSGGAEIHRLCTRGLRWLQDVPRDPVPPRRGRAGRGWHRPGPGGARAGDLQPARRHPGPGRFPPGTPHLVGRLDR